MAADIGIEITDGSLDSPNFAIDRGAAVSINHDTGNDKQYVFAGRIIGERTGCHRAQEGTMRFRGTPSRSEGDSLPWLWRARSQKALQHVRGCEGVRLSVHSSH